MVGIEKGHTQGRNWSVEHAQMKTMKVELCDGKIPSQRLHDNVCFFAESRSGRNMFAVKEQELASPCTFWLHESKYPTTPREVTSSI